MKRKSWVVGIIALILALWVSGCSSSATNPTAKNDTAKKGYVDVNAEKAVEMVQSGKFQVIDVRTLGEYKEAHIPGVKLIPVDEIEQRLKEIDPQKPVLLICRSGNRSTVAAQKLVKAGYKEVYQVVGGMLEWKGPVEKEK